jgi:very-short-patch-repair endonuclease
MTLDTLEFREKKTWMPRTTSKGHRYTEKESSHTQFRRPAMPSDYARNVVQCKLTDIIGRSPPELILGVAIFSELSDLYPGWRCWVYSEWEFQTFAASSEHQDDTFALVPQFEVSGVGHVDFAIFVPKISVKEPLVVIECDGHAYHERTPDQASEDKRRERTLQRLGIPALRFTGRDIVRNSAGAAEEIAQFVNSKLHEKAARQAEINALQVELQSVVTELMWYRYGVL